MLKWPKHLSNTAALTTLEVPTVRSRVLQRKLSFLHRVANSNPFSLSGRTVLALSQDINSLCLVKDIESSDGDLLSVASGSLV